MSCFFLPKSTTFSEALGKALLFWLPMLYYEGSSLNNRRFPSGIETDLPTTVALRGRQVERSSSRRPKKSRRLRQMSVKGRGRLLQGGDGQGLGRAKVDIVGVTAHGAMSAPGSPG